MQKDVERRKEREEHEKELEDVKEELLGKALGRPGMMLCSKVSEADNKLVGVEEKVRRAGIRFGL